MKKILFVFLVGLFFGSCTVTHYSGDIYPNSVEFNKANFRYVKTIEGSASAVYNGFGYDKTKVDGLVSKAKYYMYKTHNLLPNQVITNVTKDVLRETSIKGWGSHEIKVILTADVFEFSNNGIYSKSESNLTDSDTQENINTESNKTSKPSQTNKTFLTKEDTEGYRETNLSYRYYKKEKVIYKINNQFYKGTVYEKSSSRTVKVYNISKKINGKWILEETSGETIAETIEISAISHMK